ncbi:UNVERIFIED_CONTAM: hypothetical protein FKN15_071248 [Acipenser sinensis]
MDRKGLRHILTGYKVGLRQGRFTWRHDQMHVMFGLSIGRQAQHDQQVARDDTRRTTFCRPGEQPPRKGIKTKTRLGRLKAARDWKMLADVGQRLIFPPEISTTNLRHDIVLWSGSAHLVHLVELTVPWEAAVDEAYKRKKLRYAELAAEVEQ